MWRKSGMNEKRKKLGALLIEHGYVTSEQVKHALEVQQVKRERLGNILIELGYLDEQRFHEFLSAIEGVASIELARYGIEREIIALLPRELASRLEVVPIGSLKNHLTVAMVCPLDRVAIQELERATRMKVKAVLCSRSAVYRALDKYYRRREEGTEKLIEETRPAYGLEGLPAVAEIIKNIEDLPTLPDVVQAVSSLVNDPSSSAADLAKVISSDVALSARILKLANSPAYGFSRKVVDIKHAIALLGFKETQALAISISVLDYAGEERDFDLKSYWRHSFACATLAKLLAANLRSSEMESAFVAGLLHDVGKVVLASNVFAQRRKASTGGIKTSSLVADEERLGISHSEAGYLLVEHWLLPQALTNAIRYHHSPQQAPAGAHLPGVICLADILCKKPSSEGEPAADENVASVARLIGLSDNGLSQTLAIYRDIATDLSFF